MGKDKNKKKDKKSKKDALSKDEPVETPFNPVCYDTADVATTVKLLGSPEKPIILKALIVLDKYSLIKYENGVLLSRLGVLDYLLDLIKRDDLVVLRLSLKTLNQLLPVPAVHEELLSENRIQNVHDICQIFIRHTDPVVLETSSKILAIFCENLDTMTRIIEYEPQEKLIATLKATNDVDIQMNCLNILRSVCNLRDGHERIQHGNFFTSRVLVCYLKSPVQSIREKASDILVQISCWEDKPIHKDMRENGVIDAMLGVVMNVDNETNDFIDNAYEVLTNCAKNCEENSTYFVNCVDFFKFCLFVEQFGCRPNHLKACATILLILTASSKEVRKILFDFSVHDTILSLLRSDDPYVVSKVFQCVNNMGVNVYCSEAMLSAAVVQKVIQVIANPKLDLMPYKDVALTTVCNFLIRNPNSYKMLVHLKGVSPIIDLLQNKKAQEIKSIVNTILDIMIILSYRPESKDLIVEYGIYETILNFFTDKDVNFSTKALHILNQYVDSQECRQYFLELDGINKLIQVLTHTPSDYVIKEALLLARNLIIYRKVGMAFLMSGFLPKLKQLEAAEVNEEGKYRATIDMLLDIYLPIKFNEKGRLELTDITRNMFYMVRDGYKKDFPFLELQKHQKICPRFVMYVADFSCPEVKSVAVESSKYQLLTESLDVLIEEGLNDKTGAADNQVVSIPEETSLKSSRIGVPKMYKYVNEPINFGFLSPDPYLPRYIKVARKIIFEDDNVVYCFEHKIKVLARLVCNNITLSQQYIKHWEHSYEVHQEELKRRLGTSVIPIGYIRTGSMCERALLFKVLADRLNIPCTLVRGEHYIYYNEVFIIDDVTFTDINTESKPTQGAFQNFFCIVDLMEKPGHLLAVGSEAGNKYLQAKSKPEMSKEQAEYIHTFGLD